MNPILEALAALAVVAVFAIALHLEAVITEPQQAVQVTAKVLP